ncbi:type II secretion system protein [bacterium LRH843]|nr:type II secretion system protein [bacterium LRH843]
MKKWFQKVKNEKGLTLIELLAVVVILGIIAAIAVPSIGGIIDNTKKDAHVANATQMISSARLAVTGNSTLQPVKGSSTVIPLGYLEEEGYLETLKDPDGGITSNNGYKRGGKVINPNNPDISYVKVSRDGDSTQFTYEVRIYGVERNIPPTKEGELKRDIVKDN